MGKINLYLKLLEHKTHAIEILIVEMEELALGFLVMYFLFQWI